MSLATMLPHTCTITRLAGAGAKQTYQDVHTDVPCFVQPMSETETPELDFTYAKQVKIYFLPDADVQDGDTITDQGGRQFSIKGAVPYDFGSQHYIKAIGSREQVG
jgi:hypothetical protein